MSTPPEPRLYAVFAGHRLLAVGDLTPALTRAKKYVDDAGREPMLIFDMDTGAQVEFDFSGTLDQVLLRELPQATRVGPGRPKLGVSSREVSLMPRHWQWLEQQPAGISAALRRVVEEAMKREPHKERARRKREAAAKLMWGLAGDFQNFEEASRALYKKDQAGFESLARRWPKDVRTLLTNMLRESTALEAGRPHQPT